VVKKSESAPVGGEDAAVEQIVIKKYANRRLYNTSTSSYVTLEHLSQMVRDGSDFIVQDAKTNDDITRSVLTQIIFEQENRGQNLLPVPFLRRLIRSYGDQMQSFLPGYLEMSMEAFAKGQDRWRDQMNRAFGANLAAGAFEEQARQNMVLFEQAMRMWTPFGAFPPIGSEAEGERETAQGSETSDNLEALRAQMEAMQRQLDQLSRTRKP
jgi:polyhydroxyalkanoate synthesis repressor PhaR